MKARENLLKENKELKVRLSEAQELLFAIKSGAVDAFVTDNQQVFTLKSADSAYRVLIETINEGAATLGYDGTIMYCNKHLADMLGVSAETIAGASLLDFVIPDDVKRLKSILKQAKKETIRAELLFKRNNNSLIPVVVSCNSLKLDTKGLCVAVTDLTEQKNTELELRNNRDYLEERVLQRTLDLDNVNALLRSTIESLFDGILVVDLKGQVVQFNKRFLHLWGIPKTIAASGSEKKLLNFAVRRLKHPEEFIRGVKKVYKNPDKPTYALIQLKNGKILERYSHPHISNNRTAGTVWTFLDVTMRKKAEEKFRESEKLYRAVVEGTTAVILRMDPSGVINFANKRALEFFGYSARELIGKHAVGTVVPAKESSGRNLAKMVDQISANPEAFRNNANENICKDGRRVWLEWTNSGIYGADGKLTEFLSVGIDATMRKQAEDMLRQNKALLQAVLDNTPDAIFLKDLSSRILLANPATFAIIGKPKEAVIGKADADLYEDKETARIIMENDRRIMKSGRMEMVEETVTDERGTRVYLSTKSPYRDSDGRIIGLIGIGRDITEQKRLENELKKYNETLEERVCLRTKELADASIYHRNLIEASLDPLVTINIDGKITYANEATIKATGASREELTGNDFSTYFTEPEKAQEAYRQVFNKGLITDYP
ncbi:MAG: PAS domain S-box protein, partial [Candidatus Omnitrophica bacterium]|nr:PAS domain S-box protein [Candidatus Omnitrophota bacterium]